MVKDPNGWVPLGPSVVYNGQMRADDTDDPLTAPVSGRVTAIAIDPLHPDNVVYVGTAFGGVWKTEDGGQTWRPLTDDHLSLSVGAMAIDSNPPHHLYVASGQTEVFLGTGMKIYDPVLDTWAFKNDEKLLTDVKSSAIVVDSRSPANIRILIGTDKALIESNDNGATWHRLPVSPSLPVLLEPPPEPVTAVVLNPGATVGEDRLYVAIQGDGVYRKKGTEEFKRLPPHPLPAPAPGTSIGELPAAGTARRITLAICSDNPKRLYALYAKPEFRAGVLGIYRTDDGGDTWIAVNPPFLTITKQANFNAVLAADHDRLFFGETRLWRSETMGEGWAVVSKPKGDSRMHPDQHAIAFHPNDRKKIWVGNDGGVWFSKDGGDTWQNRNRSLQTMQYYSLAQHPHEESILLAGSQDNGTQRFEGHPAWHMVKEGDGFFCAIDPVDPSYWYGSYVFQDPSDRKIKAILRSHQGGDEGSWSRIIDGIGASDTEPDPFYVPFVLDPSNPEVLYLGTSKLYRTKNRGNRWRPVLKASDGTAFKTGDLPEQAITAICVHPKDSDTVYIGTYDGRVFHLGEAASGLYTTVNNPSSADLPGRYIADIAVPSDPLHPTAPPSEIVYVAIGSDHHRQKPNITPLTDRLFRSDNRGTSWKPLNLAGLVPPIQGVPIDHQANSVNAIALDPSNPTHVYIGCDIGVFKSTDRGEHWAPFRENLPNSPIADLQIHDKKRLLRAATIGRGIWERRLDPPPVSPRAGIYVRDNLLDMGRRETLKSGQHPLETVEWHSGADIIVDTRFGLRGFQKPVSTIDYTLKGAIDYIAFVQLKHHNPRARAQSRVYVEVINRGPDDANDVAVRVFYAAKDPAVADGVFPDLPSNFWTAFPDADPATSSAWKPLGPKQVIDKLRPAEPRIVQWDWDVPASLTGKAALLAVITGNEDLLNETRLDAGLVARENNHVALRQVEVGIASAAIVPIILTAIGLAREFGVANIGSED